MLAGRASDRSKPRERGTVSAVLVEAGTTADLERAAAGYRAAGWPLPRVVLVAGSGLSVDLPGSTTGRRRLGELAPFELPELAGHPLEFEVLEPPGGEPGGGAVLYFRGRLHAYQGYAPAEVVFQVRLAALLGARVLVATNAAGGLDPSMRPGDLWLLRDHINLTGHNPLCGRLPAAWGPVFPDMSRAYDSGLRRAARECAERLGFGVSQGVYVGLLGPSFETPAEITMLRRIGGDLVGMSTVLEVIAAHHMGLRCLGISLVSNLAAGLAEEHLGHEDVLARGKAAAGRLGALLAALLVHPALAV